MRESWRSFSGVGLVVLATITHATGVDDEDGYKVMTMGKDQNLVRFRKRELACQLSSWTVCPSSEGGGCCPENFSCGTSSCYAATAGPSSACGQLGRFSCPLSAGAGRRLRSTARSTILPIMPVRLLCLPFIPRIWMLRKREDSKGSTTITVVTSTATVSDGPPTTSSTSVAASTGAVSQAVASTVAKMDAIQTDTGDGDGSGGGGLSSAALGGIIAGVIIVLITVIVAAFFIIRHLKRAEKAAQKAEKAAESRRESSSGQHTRSRSRKPGFGTTSVSEVDGTDVDPLGQPRHSSNRRDRSVSNSSAGGRNLHGGSGTSSPPFYISNFSSIVPSDASDGRQSSLDSYPHHHGNPQRVSQQSQPPQRPSYDSQVSRPTVMHERQNSDVSEVAESHGVSELETPMSTSAARRSSGGGNAPGTTAGKAPARGRGDSNAAAPLSTVNETENDFSELHGYYGPPELGVGQTAARLARGSSAGSSVPSPYPL
ncbi:hypothetical protein F4780DRAFT_426091 [Xylariomycetidae sp. FL0641]|nr:hypothetical protein F4780DRAFT_426091 [Xylariomycetidae sp. FL0641]